MRSSPSSCALAPRWQPKVETDSAQKQEERKAKKQARQNRESTRKDSEVEELFLASSLFGDATAQEKAQAESSRSPTRLPPPTAERLPSLSKTGALSLAMDKSDWSMPGCSRPGTSNSFSISFLVPETVSLRSTKAPLRAPHPPRTAAPTTVQPKIGRVRRPSRFNLLDD